MNLSQCANSSTAGVEYALCLDEMVMEEGPGWSICPDLTLCNSSQSGDNVGLAFGLTIGAGLATTLGALVPFIPCIKRANTRLLAIGLGVAAGVMLYVSFTEIWKKSRDNFCCLTQDHFDLLSTLCFFGGILFTIILDIVVSVLQKLECGCCFYLPRKRGIFSRHRGKSPPVHATNAASHHSILKGPCSNGLLRRSSSNSSASIHHMGHSTLAPEGHGTLTPEGHGTLSPEGHGTLTRTSDVEVETNLNADPSLASGDSVQGIPGGMVPTPMSGKADSDSVTADGTSTSVTSTPHSANTNSCASMSVTELFSNSSLLRMNAVIEVEEGEGRVDTKEQAVGDEVEVEDGSPSQCAVEFTKPSCVHEMVEEDESGGSSSEEALGPEELKEVVEVLGKSTRQLQRMGILTGLAIGIHNFPEGLATFVATLSSPSLGAALAIAIALHNVPEGLCVAMPVYYATGSRLKGFLWAFLSGISEPLGALLGWVVLRKFFGPLVYGVTFGLIAGMMVYISLKELLPTAYKFDSTNGKLVSGCLVFGMAIMAVSLILFLY